MANWERKSSYLLQEIVKFTTYVDCLKAAQSEKEKFYAARAKSSHDLQSANETAAIQSTEASAKPMEGQVLVTA